MSSACKILKENNPFYSNSHPDPWVPNFPNITSLNGDVFDSIIRIIGHNKTHPHEPIGVLVNGESGSGKTHMIARIREYCEHSGFDVKFAAIKPIIDYQAPLRRVLKGIITNLAHPTGDSRHDTQIHGLIFSLIWDFYTHNPDTQTVIKKAEKDYKRFFSVLYQNKKRLTDFFGKVESWILAEIPGLNKVFVQLLFSFCHPDLQQIAKMRLMGEICDPDDAHALHIPYQEPSDPAMEDEARDFLISLGLILSRYGQNLIVCFDQLENLTDQDLIKAFDRIIFTLINDCRSIIPLTFTRTLFWEKKLYPNLDPSSRERIAMNQFSLHGCTDQEIEDIIRTRIQGILTENWETPYNWLITEIKKTIHKNPSPRVVIRCADSIILTCEISSPGIPHATPMEIIHAAYTNERDLILSDLDSWPPDSEELTEAIRIYLTSRRYDIRYTKPGRKSILQVHDGKSGCCIIINTNQNHSAIGSGFATGTQYLKEHPGASCIYLTDPRCIVTKQNWKPTNQKKDEFIAAGGKILQPSTSDIARFYALYSLSCKIVEGDIQIDTGTGIRSATSEELIAYICDETLFPPLFQEKTQPEEQTGKKPHYPDEQIHTTLCQILTQKPMHIMAVNTLSEEVIRKGLSITSDELIIWCGKHADSFRIIQSQQGSMIIFRGSSHPCSP